MQIIAGDFKGHKLLGPPGKLRTRPITGAAKKSLFEILSPEFPGATVLDLYCGTGTLGLEALSRGAGRCYFAERDRAAIDRLRRNVENLGLTERSVIWRGDLESSLSSLLTELDEKIHVAFVDPPYDRTRKWDWEIAERRVFSPVTERLAPEGLLVLRTPADLTTPNSLGGLVICRSKRYTGMLVTIYHHGKG